MGKESKVSVIIPAYNVGKYISNTINSVLNQTYNKESVEIIIVNDGSTDNTLKKLQEFSRLNQVSIIDVENGGVSRARNLGIQRATGDYISFLDGDDTWDFEFLSQMVSFIQKNELLSASCLFNRIEKDTVSNEIKKIPQKNELFNWYIGHQGMTINTNSWLIRKKIITKYKLFFVEGCQFGEDTEFFTKVILHSEKEKWGVLEKRLTNYHIRKGSLTNSGEMMKLFKVEMYFDTFQRTYNYFKEFKLTAEELTSFKNRVYLYYIVYLASFLIKGRKLDYRKLKNRFKNDQKLMNFGTPKKMNINQMIRFILVKLDFILLIFKTSNNEK